MCDNRCIGIIGSGNMGLALAHRLSLYGFTVTIGSRFPNKQNSTQYQAISLVECIRRSPIIFLAVQPEHYTDCILSLFQHEPSLFHSKILVDLSNGSCNGSSQSHDDISNAERLQMAIPQAFVVKAFNTISSFFMQMTTSGESRHVFVASDYVDAKEKIITLARELNFDAFNAGPL